MLWFPVSDQMCRALGCADWRLHLHLRTPLCFSAQRQNHRMSRAGWDPKQLPPTAGSAQDQRNLSQSSVPTHRELQDSGLCLALSSPFRAHRPLGHNPSLTPSCLSPHSSSPDWNDWTNPQPAKPSPPSSRPLSPARHGGRAPACHMAGAAGEGEGGEKGGAEGGVTWSRRRRGRGAVWGAMLPPPRWVRGSWRFWTAWDGGGGATRAESLTRPAGTELGAGGCAAPGGWRCSFVVVPVLFGAYVVPSRLPFPPRKCALCYVAWLQPF